MQPLKHALKKAIFATLSVKMFGHKFDNSYLAGSFISVFTFRYAVQKSKIFFLVKTVYPNETCHIFFITEGQSLQKRRQSPLSTITKKAKGSSQSSKENDSKTLSQKNLHLYSTKVRLPFLR